MGEGSRRQTPKSSNLFDRLDRLHAVCQESNVQQYLHETYRPTPRLAPIPLVPINVLEKNAVRQRAFQRHDHAELNAALLIRVMFIKAIVVIVLVVLVRKSPTFTPTRRQLKNQLNNLAEGVLLYKKDGSDGVCV